MAVATGRLKIVVGDDSGAELLISLRGPGDLLGELALRDTSRRTATVIAVDDCTVHVLSAPVFERFLADRALTSAFQDYLMAKLSQTVPYQITLVHFSSRQRIARLLLELVALAEPRDPKRLWIPFSQDAIAKALGLVRSTVADHLAGLRQDGTLLPGPRLIVDDLRALADNAGVTPRK